MEFLEYIGKSVGMSGLGVCRGSERCLKCCKLLLNQSQLLSGGILHLWVGLCRGLTNIKFRLVMEFRQGVIFVRMEVRTHQRVVRLSQGLWLKSGWVAQGCQSLQQRQVRKSAAVGCAARWRQQAIWSLLKKGKKKQGNMNYKTTLVLSIDNKPTVSNNNTSILIIMEKQPNK